jgi:hypothetical protein
MGDKQDALMDTPLDTLPMFMIALTAGNTGIKISKKELKGTSN